MFEKLQKPLEIYSWFFVVLSYGKLLRTCFYSDASLHFNYYYYIFVAAIQFIICAKLYEQRTLWKKVCKIEKKNYKVMPGHIKLMPT